MNRKRNFASALAVFLSLLLYFCWQAARPALRADARQEIVRLAQVMGWQPGFVVADIGAGDGSYSFEASDQVGPSGRVFATEIDPDKLKTLRADVTSRKIANVTIVEGAAADTKLSSACCDVIFLRHVYHHITHPADFDKNLLRSLKPGGQLAIIDFPPDPNLPPVKDVPKNRGGHGIPQKIMMDELTSAGFQVKKVINDWSGRDYCVIFTKRTP